MDPLRLWKIVFNGRELIVGPPPTSLQGHQVFTSNGIFTVPDGVTEVMVIAVGGGGGGGSTLYSKAPILATDGGSSSFGSFLLAQGGKAGESYVDPNYTDPFAVGGSGFNKGGDSLPNTAEGVAPLGSNGAGINGGRGGPNDAQEGSTGGGGYGGGGGATSGSSPGSGSSADGSSGGGGGGGFKNIPYAPTTIKGGDATVWDSAGAGGGGSGFVESALVSVTPGQNINITVGAGGVGGKMVDHDDIVLDSAGDGAPGVVVVMWGSDIRTYDPQSDSYI